MRGRRRNLTTTTPAALAALACLVAGACGTDTGGSSAADASGSGGLIGEGQTLVVGGPQSNIIDAIRSSGFDEEFRKRTGAEIEWNAGQAPDNLTKLVQSKGGAPPFDVVFMDNVAQYRAVQAGVLEEFDKQTLVDSGAHLPAEAFPNEGYGPAWVAIRLGSCINTDAYSANPSMPPPDGVEGWFDPGLAGHISLPSPNNFYWLSAMPAFAKHYGVNLDDPQPLIDRFARIDAQSLFTSSSDAQSALQSQAVWLAPITDGRCLGLKLAGEPVDFRPLNLQIDGKTWPYVGLLDTWDVVKGTERAELAEVFIDMVEGELGLRGLVSEFGYVPARVDLQEAAKADPKLAGLIADFTYDDIYLPKQDDMDVFLGDLRDWTDKWTQAFSG